MKIAVIGATGLVGSVMLKVLNEFGLGSSEIIAVASDRSIGHKVHCGTRELSVISAEECLLANPDIAIFSAGSKASKMLAPLFAKKGCFVIDNSSCWRMDPLVPLVVPEINAAAINSNTRIIANPNCSTIQMVLALSGLHKRFGIKRIVVSTYQSITGTGVKAVKQMESERLGPATEMAYPHQIDMNCFPHGGDFLANGYTTEEEKLLFESRKILSDNDMEVTATVVRIPVKGGHSEAVNVEFKSEFDLDEVISILQNTSGVLVQDDPVNNIYPMPLWAEGRNEVFVGRIRRDFSQPNTLNLWVVSDNLRKGAATNAVQIALYLIAEGLVKSH